MMQLLLTSDRIGFYLHKEWVAARFAILLHSELQVNFGSNRILSTQRVGGGAVCIFFYTESCKLTNLQGNLQVNLQVN